MVVEERLEHGDLEAWFLALVLCVLNHSPILSSLAYIFHLVGRSFWVWRGEKHSHNSYKKEEIWRQGRTQPKQILE